MVNATRQDYEISLLEPNPHPVISLTSDIKVASAIQNVPDLLVLMKMLVKEALHLLLVDVAHFVGRHRDFIPVLVVAGCGDCVNTGNVGNIVINDAEFGEVVWVNRATRVVWLALVALQSCETERLKQEVRAYGEVIEPVGLHCIVEILFICCIGVLTIGRTVNVRVKWESGMNIVLGKHQKVLDWAIARGGHDAIRQ